MNKHVVPNQILLPEIGKMVAEGITVTLRGKGNSMLPFIVGGRDSVVLAQVGQLGLGDIVLADIADGHFVLHRIVQIEGSRLTLMGDGNLVGTEHCTTREVLAKVIRIVRNGREVDPSDKWERRKVYVWQKLCPVRRWLLAIYRRTHRSE